MKLLSLEKIIMKKKMALKIVPEDNKVDFVDDIKEDLARRDFSINAMAYNEADGIVDLYNGQKDIENKVINFVGNAEERIIEDPLRILRAFRFMSRLGFSLSENTIEAIKSKKIYLLVFQKKELLWNLVNYYWEKM